MLNLLRPQRLKYCVVYKLQNLVWHDAHNQPLERLEMAQSSWNRLAQKRCPYVGCAIFSCVLRMVALGETKSRQYYNPCKVPPEYKCFKLCSTNLLTADPNSEHNLKRKLLTRVGFALPSLHTLSFLVSY